MNIKCLFGHKWILVEGDCQKKCSICGKKSALAHKWKRDYDCQCERCGTIKINSFDKIYCFRIENIGNDKDGNINIPVSSEQIGFSIPDYPLLVDRSANDGKGMVYSPVSCEIITQNGTCKSKGFSIGEKRLITNFETTEKPETIIFEGRNSLKTERIAVDGKNRTVIGKDIVETEEKIVTTKIVKGF
jgi:hypothetical protein